MRSAQDAVARTGARGRAITVGRLTIEAGIAALEGRPSDALRDYRAAIRGWRDAVLPVLEALTAIDMATVLDPDLPGVRDAGAAAREILTRLEATPFIARLDAALAARPAPVSPATADREPSPTRAGVSEGPP